MFHSIASGSLFHTSHSTPTSSPDNISQSETNFQFQSSPGGSPQHQITRLSILHSHVFIQYCENGQRDSITSSSNGNGHQDATTETNSTKTSQPKPLNYLASPKCFFNGRRFGNHVSSSSSDLSSQQQQQKDFSPSSSQQDFTNNTIIRLNDRLKYLFWLPENDILLGSYRIQHLVRVLTLDAEGCLKGHVEWAGEWIPQGEINVLDRLREKHRDAARALEQQASATGKSSSGQQKDGDSVQNTGKKLLNRASMLLGVSSSKRNNKASHSKASQQPNGTSSSGSKSEFRIKNACIVQNSILVIHTTDNQVVAYKVEFSQAQSQPGRKDITFGTEKELLQNMRITLASPDACGVSLYHHMDSNHNDYTRHTQVVKKSTSPRGASNPATRNNISPPSPLVPPQQQQPLSPYPRSPSTSPSHTIDWNQVQHLEPAKEGIWIFTPHRTYYMSLHALFDTFVSKQNQLTCSDFPITSLFTGSEKLKTNSGEGQECLNVPSSSSPYVHYIARVVHGVSRELVTLDEKGIIRVYSVSPLIRTKIIVSSLTLDPVVSFVKKQRQSSSSDLLSRRKSSSKRRSLKATSKSRVPCDVQLFFTHCHFLCVTNSEQCLLVAPKIRTFLGEVHLPSEIFMQKHNFSKRSSSSSASTNMVWESTSSQQGLGIFSQDKIYRFEPPPIRDVMQQWHMSNHSKTMEGKKQFAEFLRELGHANWFVKIYLDIMMQEGKRNEISRVTKKKIMDLLCAHLENPSLVWSSSNSLSEQNQIIEQVQQFLMRFPLQSEFWNYQPQAKKAIDRLFEQLDPLHAQNPTPKQVFESMTWLNLSVAPKLAQSVSLAIDHIHDENEKKRESSAQANSDTQPEHPSKTEASKKSHSPRSLRSNKPSSTPDALDLYSDIELHDKLQELAPQILSSLLKRYNLGILTNQSTNSILQKLKEDDDMTTPAEDILKECLLHNDEYSPLDLSTLKQCDFLVENYSSCMESFHPQTQLPERNRAQLHNQSVLNGFNHLDLLVQCLYYSDSPLGCCLLVLLLEMRKRFVLQQQEQEYKEKALDYTQKQQFAALLQKNYKQIFAKLVLDVLNDVIPYLDANLTPYASSHFETEAWNATDSPFSTAMKPSQVSTIGCLMEWANMPVDALKLYLHHERHQDVTRLLDQQRQKRQSQQNVDAGAAPSSVSSSNSSQLERQEMVQILARFYAQNAQKLPNEFKATVVKEMRRGRLSRIEYLDVVSHSLMKENKQQGSSVVSSPSHLGTPTSPKFTQQQDTTETPILLEDGEGLTLEELLPVLNLHKKTRK